MIVLNINDARPGLPVMIDATHTMYPSSIAGHLLMEGGPGIELAPEGMDTFYLYVYDGIVTVRFGDSSEPGAVMVLPRGSYVSGHCALVECQDGAGPSARVAVIQRRGFRGQRTVGAIEKVGRLSYIDGCSDSMLVYPPRMGDPVLNHLHFPPGVVQTQHLHPSIRLGLVAYGTGQAWGPGWTEKLAQGVLFMLEEQEIHSFRTDHEGTDIEKGDHMGVIAYHPDSDWGPVDGNHPMLNRTYIRHGGGR